MPKSCPVSAGLLAVGGKVYVPCPRYANDNTHIPANPGKLFCLDQNTGAIAWSAQIASKFIWVRSPPVLADGKVAWSGTRKGSPPTSVVQAWNAVTGQSAWEVPINGLAIYSFGVTDGKVFYFSAATQFSGGRQVGPHETLAIEAATGKVLWRTDQAASGLHLALKDDRLYLYDSALTCLSAKDGAVVWGKGGYMPDAKWISIGADYIALRGVGGNAIKFRLADGTVYPGLQKGGNLGGDGHACGPVGLTPNLSVNVTRDGLHVRDTKTGALLWLSPGFMPTGCHSPSIANGRVYWPSSGSGMIYCWEPSDK